MFLSKSLDFLLNYYVMLFAFAIFMFNFFKRKDDKSLVITSVVMMLIFASAHFFLGWLNSLPGVEDLLVRYHSRMIFYMTAFAIVFLIYLLIPGDNNGRIPKDLMYILFFGGLLNLLMDMDANHFPLNKLHLVITGQEPEPNVYGSDEWWFWTFYSWSIYLSDILILLILALGNHWANFKWHPIEVYKRSKGNA